VTDAELRAAAIRRMKDGTLFHLGLSDDPAFLREAIVVSHQRLFELAAFAAGLDEVPRRRPRPPRPEHAQGSLWQDSCLTY
jgi:hypothetical protein